MAKKYILKPRNARRVKKVLALRSEGLSPKEISDLAHVRVGTVKNWFKRADSLSLTWDVVKDLRYEELQEVFFRSSVVDDSERYPINYEKVVEGLCNGKLLFSCYAEYRNEALSAKEKDPTALKPFSYFGFENHLHLFLHKSLRRH